MSHNFSFRDFPPHIGSSQAGVSALLTEEEASLRITTYHGGITHVMEFV